MVGEYTHLTWTSYESHNSTLGPLTPALSPQYEGEGEAPTRMDKIKQGSSVSVR
ncbi:MAG: hypothetical protein JWP03_3852 [Phycisphaerales bacterium]|nr:hypothetical protein [Phycisphaerales bacterium]